MSTQIGTATDYLDLLDKLDAFLVTTGHAWGKTYTGTGTGDLTDYLGTATSVAETFTITAINATTFSVVGNVTGALANATVGTPYTSAKIAFTITAGGTAFEAGDVFAINTSPKWERLRAAGCADQNKRSTNLVNLESAWDGTATSVASKSGPTAYVDFEMVRPNQILEIVLNCNDAGNRSPKDFSLQYKDNVGDSWTTAQAWTNQTWTQTYQAKQLTLSSAPGNHKFWRFEITAVNGIQDVYLADLALRDAAGGTYRMEEHAEFVWKAPGIDGTKDIYIGCDTYGTPQTDIYNLGFHGFRVWDSTKPIASQQNPSGGRYLNLLNSPTGYWFVVNGQRAIVVTKASGVYQTAYFGFGFPYETPSVHPFPMTIGASYHTRGVRYDNTSPNVRHPADPGRYGLTAYYPDNVWRNHVNRYASDGSIDSSFDSATPGKVWPTAVNFSGTMFSDQRENLDGSRALLPLILWHQSSPTHVWGEFDGYYCTTGFSITAESIIRENNFDHLVVNNIYRVGLQHYAAVRLD